MHSGPSSDISPAFDGAHAHRSLFIFKVLAWISAAFSLCWLAFYAMAGFWLVAESILALGLVCLFATYLALKGRISASLLLAQVACVVFICCFAVAFDIPDQEAPRVVHLYLLPLALIGYLNYQRQNSWPQLLVILTCLVAFVVFASMTVNLSAPVPLPHEVRSVANWINATAATLFLAGGMVMANSDILRNSNLSRELWAAVGRGELELFYQAQVDRDGKTIGAEALLRWNHPKRGYISPADFIPAAQQSGLMPKIGSWVLQEACRTLTAWDRRETMRELTLSINITADHFLHRDFVQSVAGTITAHSVNPRRLKLELTESVFVADVEGLVAKMTALQDIGVGIALDDFGTGYSSLSYLRRLPLTQLKIDRSFVRDVSENELDASLARNIVQMGHDLSLDVLAEGVETEAQYRFMLDCGCSALQGYYFGRPMSLDDFERRVPTTA